MKAIDLRNDLDRMISDYGVDFDVAIQDSPSGMYPECSKHRDFFIVEEPRDDVEGIVMELVLRAWPY